MDRKEIWLVSECCYMTKEKQCKKIALSFSFVDGDNYHVCSGVGSSFLGEGNMITVSKRLK